MSKSRNWVFTLNNYTDEEVTHLRNEENVPDLYRYICWGFETAPSTGTPHLQGYVVFKNLVRMQTVKTALGAPRIHVQPMRGTLEQNRDYCNKGGEFEEHGQRPMSQQEKGNAQKRRYEDAWEAALTGNMDAIDADIRIRHYNTLKRIHADSALAKDVTRLPHDTVNYWFHGTSGTGKSRAARDRWPDAYLKMCNKWWDGYSGQDVVLIEDFDVKHAVLVHHLKIWADIYPFLMEVKGGASKIRPKMIVVTSNYFPGTIWTENSDLGPILRRFQTIHFESLEHPPMNLPAIVEPEEEGANPGVIEILD